MGTNPIAIMDKMIQQLENNPQLLGAAIVILRRESQGLDCSIRALSTLFSVSNRQAIAILKSVGRDKKRDRESGPGSRFSASERDRKAVQETSTQILAGGASTTFSDDGTPCAILDNNIYITTTNTNKVPTEVPTEVPLTDLLTDKDLDSNNNSDAKASKSGICPINFRATKKMRERARIECFADLTDRQIDYQIVNFKAWYREKEIIKTRRGFVESWHHWMQKQKDWPEGPSKPIKRFTG